MKELSDFREKRGECGMLRMLSLLLVGTMVVLLCPVSASGQWTITTVDSETGRDIGQYSSIAIDSGGKAHISYMDYGGVDPVGRLKYATNVSGPWEKTVVDSSTNTGYFSSIAIGQSDHVHISYRSESGSGLRYATNATGTWLTYTPVTYNLCGFYSSIVVNPSDDHVYISHVYIYPVDGGGSNNSLSVVDFLASCAGDSGCYSSSLLEGATPDHFFDTSIILDTYLMPHVSYGVHRSRPNDDTVLKHGYYVAGVGWTNETVDDPTVDDVGPYSSIAVDSYGNVHISYYDATNGDLKYAVYDVLDATWLIRTLDSTGDVGKYSSIAIDANDDVHISYYDETNGNLKYLKYTDPLETGGSYSIITLDAAGDVGQYSDIAVDSAGYVHISYYDATNAALKYATNAPSGPCTYAISPDTLSFGKTGGTGRITLTAGIGCAWTATTTDDWITIDTGASGSGNGTVTYSVSPNDGDSRTGTISVAGYSHTVNQSSAGCDYSVNLQEFYIPASGGTGYRFAVTAGDGCAWTVNNSDPSWVEITSGRSGIGNGTVEFSVEPNMGAERSGSLSIEGETLAVTQRDNTLTASLTQIGSWVRLTFDNDTGDDILTIRPSCYRTYFFMTDALGNIVPQRDFITAVAIPDDVVTIPTTGFTLNCDLTRLFAPQIFSLFTPPFTLMATYANYVADAAGDDSCTDNPPCYNLWTGAIPSGSITLDMTDIPTSEPETASVNFFPSLWNVDWASGSSETITAVIEGLTGTPDPSTILLNGTVGIIPGSFSSNSPITVQFSAQAAVQSLGSIGIPVEGNSVRMYPRVSVRTTEGDFFTAQNGVEVYTSEALVENALTIDAVKHTVASGTHPATKKEPIPNMAIRIYDKSPGSCAANLGISWKHYPSIWGSGTAVGCLPIAQEMTDANGRAVFDLPEGDYLAIGKYVDGAETIYPGVSVGAIAEGAPVYKQLQIIVNAKNEKVPAKYRKFTGSELLVIEPEYVEWDGTEELYPFVFESIGDWGVSIAISPPEGFVADRSVLGTDVNTAVKAVQFTITDVGSKWIPTDVEFTIKHKKKTINVKDKVGIKLSPRLAAQKGISIYGEEDAQDDKPQDKKKGKGK